MASLPGPFLRVGFFPHHYKKLNMIAVIMNGPAPDPWFQVFFALAAFAVVRGIANLIAWIKKRRKAKQDAEK